MRTYTSDTDHDHKIIVFNSDSQLAEIASSSRCLIILNMDKAKKNKVKEAERQRKIRQRQKREFERLRKLHEYIQKNHKDIMTQFDAENDHVQNSEEGSRMQVNDPNIKPSEPDELRKMIDEYIEEYPLLLDEDLLQLIGTRFIEASADDILNYESSALVDEVGWMKSNNFKYK